MLRSLVGKLYSPFQAKNPEHFATGEGQDNDEEDRDRGANRVDARDYASSSRRLTGDVDQAMRSSDDVSQPPLFSLYRFTFI